MNAQKVICSDLSLWPIVDAIRWFVQDTSFFKTGFMATRKGSLLLSSVEAVYLTDGMLTTFIRNAPPSDDFGRSLWFWGAIQALVVQQDAIIHLGRALNKNPQSVTALIGKSPIIDNIRDLRNRTAGHPMIDVQTGNKHTFPAVHEGRTYSFLLLDENTDPPSFQKCDMDMCDLIGKQQDVLSEIATEWRLELMQEENSFRDSQAVPSLEALLSLCAFAYHVSNLNLDLNKTHLSSAQELRAIVNNISVQFQSKGALKNGASDIIDSMKYPIDELIRYFESNSHLIPVDIPIFNGFLLSRFEELKTIAIEIDAEYRKRFTEEDIRQSNKDDAASVVVGLSATQAGNGADESRRPSCSCRVGRKEFGSDSQ